MRRIRFQAAVTTLSFVACSGGGGGTAPDDDDDDPGPGNQQTLGAITANVPSLSLTAGNTATISITAVDVNNQPIGTFGNPTFTSTNTNVAVVEANGEVRGLAAGTGAITISLTHGGATKTTQVPVTVTGTLPAVESVVASSSDYIFTPRVVAVQAGGSVTWNFGALEHTVTFASAAGVPNSINTGGVSASISRTFGTPGNFAYSCSIHPGMNGLVYVR